VAKDKLMSLKFFLTSKLFLKNLGLAFLITIVLILITLFFIARFTNRGANIPAPNFTGLSLDEVKKIADQKDCRFMIRDSVFRVNIKPGTVLVQNPLAGHIIKPGRVIYLTVASVLPERVEVPKLTDISLRQARVLLESKGFALGKVEFRPSEFDGLVLDQKYNGRSISQGTWIDNGSAIDLVVGGKGIGGETTVPHLIGLNLAAAKDSIIARLLTSGAVIFDTSVHTAIDTMNASVWRQIPPADSLKMVITGSSVDLWLRMEREDTIQGHGINEQKE
jgi:eukaryotic-like serine/threonine-protein kinase